MQTASPCICNNLITLSLTISQSPQLYRIKRLPVGTCMPHTFTGNTEGELSNTEIQQTYILSKHKCEQMWRLG